MDEGKQTEALGQVDLGSNEPSNNQMEAKGLICEECNNLVKKNQLFESPDRLKKVLEGFVAKHCFSTVKNSTKFRCIRSGQKQLRNEVEEKRLKSTLKAGCPFEVRFF